MTGAAESVSRDVPGTPPKQPTLGGALLEAAVDFYFNSWRLAPANLAWAGVLVAIIVAASVWPPAWLLVGLLALPLAGIHRLGGRIVRGDGGSFSDFVDGTRRFALPALTLGFAATILAVVFTTNVVLGLQLDNPVGWFLSATALYADIGLAMALVAAWPLLVDPRREHLPLRRRLALALLVLLARPGRMLLLTLLVVVILAVSTALVAGLALVGVAYASLVATRYVLPLADLVERRLPERD